MRKPGISWRNRGHEYYFTTPSFLMITVAVKDGEKLDASLLIASGEKVHGPYKSEFLAAKGAMDVLGPTVKKIQEWRRTETKRKAELKGKKQ